MYLFFDTETNGKALNQSAPYTNVNNWPRITQLGFQVFNDEGKCFKTFNHLIKPDGWKIPTEEELIKRGERNPKFFVNNNMSTERCEKEGIDIKIALNSFLTELEQCKYLLAHNLDFDKPVILAELLRYNRIPTLTNKPKSICTMKETTELLKLPGGRGGGYKYPSLTELHKHLFNADFSGAHDADVDVSAMAKCFFELRKRGLPAFQHTLL